MSPPNSTDAAERLRNELDTLLILRARIQRRLDEAPPFSPDWDAAVSHAEELDRRLADLRQYLHDPPRRL
jgi:hypothetical protein